MSGIVPEDITIDTAGLATSDNQTNGSQKSQIVDAGGEAVTVTGGKLDVNASVDTTGLATSAKQDTGNTLLSTIASELGSPLDVTGSTVAVGASALPSGAAIAANQQTNAITDAQIRATPLPISGTVTANTGLTQPLTDTQLRATPVPVSGTVTVDTSLLATAAKQDTGNTSLSSIDTKLTSQSTASKQDAQTALLTTIDGDTSNLDVALSTRLKAADTLAGVTTVGTVTAVTAITNALPAGNNNIGDVDVASIAAGDNNIGNVDIVTMPNVVIGSGTVTTVSTVTSVTQNADVRQATAANLNMTEASAAAIKTAVEIMDDWDETDRAKVNPIAGQAGVAALDGNVDALTQRVVIAANVLSTVNSSTTPLTSFSIFTGTSEDIMSYNEVRITVYSDVPSLPDGFSIQQSTDNTNWIITDTYTIAAATGKTFSVPRQARYFRVVYYNSYVAQSTFILQTSFTRIGGKSSSQRPSDNYTNQTDLEQQQAFLMNYNSTTDSWYRTRGDSTNGLMVNPNGFNVEYDRRLQEQIILEMYEDSNRNFYNTESYTSGRRGFELR